MLFTFVKHEDSATANIFAMCYFHVNKTKLDLHK